LIRGNAVECDDEEMSMPEQRTKSELLFDQYPTEHGYDFDPQPRVPGKTSRLDHIVRFDGAEIFFEVKEFDEGEELPDGAFDPYKRIYLKLKGSWKQLNEYREYSCSLVLYTDGAAPVYLKPEFVLGAMLGTVTYITDKKSKVVGRFFGDQSGFLTGHMIDYKIRCRAAHSSAQSSFLKRFRSDK
jgi:hypothetical protein